MTLKILWRHFRGQSKSKETRKNNTALSLVSVLAYRGKTWAELQTSVKTFSYSLLATLYE